MNLKTTIKTGGWIVALSFLVGSFAAGILLINQAGEAVEPPSKDELKIASRTKSKKFRANRKKNLKKDKKIKIKKHEKKNKKKSPGITKPSHPKITLPANLGTHMPGTGNRPLSLVNMKPKREEDAKNGQDYDEIKKKRRLKRDKRCFQRIPDRISRLEKRLEVLEGKPTKSAQADRLKQSIARFKTRKIELERRLQDAGELE